ncbi:MAG: TonB-dependent receptor [Candidatus Marinimicrobia bacterium]|nr:TonB-dependent receptor [Candidatus Neomarinimicrobiota bacterium]
MFSISANITGYFLRRLPQHLLTIGLVLAVLACPDPIAAQDLGRVSGYLRDGGSGEPLRYANVVLEGTGLGAASDVHGRYLIMDIPPGNYRLKVMMLGYATEAQELVMTPGADLRLDLELAVEAISTEGVTVTAERVRFEQVVEVSRVNLSLREIKATPALMEADLFRTLQLMPGVRATNDFSSALVVRGGSPDENLILLDGIEVYNPFHLGGIFSTFNTDALAEAEFMAGGFPSPYGNRNSSVLEITSKEGNSKGGRFFKNSQLGRYWNLSQAQGEISLLSSKLLLEGPILNGSWMLAWRRTYYDQLANLYYWYKDQDPLGSYYFRDLHGKVIYNFSPTDRLILATYQGRDFAFIEVDEDESDVGVNLNWGNTTRSAQWRHVPNSRFVSVLSLANTRYDWDLNVGITQRDTLAGETSTDIIQTVELRDWTLKERLDWFVNANHTITTGFELKALSMGILQQFGDITFIDQEQNPYILSAFLQDRWELNPRLSVQPGLRLSKYELHNQLYLEPRMGFKFMVTDDLALKGSWGIYKQFLFTNSSEDAILNFVDFWLPVPKANRAQSAQHFIVGLEQWIGAGFYTSLEAYYKPYDNILDTNPRNDPAREDDDFIEGTATAYGIELLIKKSTGRLSGWLGYTYARLEKEVDFNNDGEIVWADGERYSPKYDQPHTLNVVAAYRLTKKNSFGLTVSLSSGQPYTPVWGKTYTQSGMGDFLNPYADLQTIPGRKNSARIPTYFRLDVSWTRDVRWFWVDGKFKLQVINATNHFNTLIYFWDHSRSPSEVTAVGMFPFLPSLSWEFQL